MNVIHNTKVLFKLQYTHLQEAFPVVDYALSLTAKHLMENLKALYGLLSGRKLVYTEHVHLPEVDEGIPVNNYHTRYEGTSRAQEA
jgi:hypothetical protein